MLEYREAVMVEFVDGKSWRCPHCHYHFYVSHFMVGKSECPRCGGGILWLPEIYKYFE